MDIPAPVIERAEWCDDAARGLSECFGHDTELIVAGVRNGTLELWRIDGGASWMVTRIEGGELIVCCYQGSRLKEVSALVTEAARRKGLRAIRFYTARPALARLLEELGFRPTETVYRCEV